MHDLDPVRCGQNRVVISRARNDGSVTLHRYLAPIETEHREQPTYRLTGWQRAAFTVDRDRSIHILDMSRSTHPDKPRNRMDAMPLACYRPRDTAETCMPIPSDPDAIRTLAHILRDTGLTEIEIVDGDARLRLVRAPAMVAALVAQPAPASIAIAADLGADTLHPGAVPSPMVGVAYLSAEPGTAPFVVPGQAVTAGQTVLLIEAMKTFNQIKAPRAGTLTRILVASGQPVEYDQPLFIIDPA